MQKAVILHGAVPPGSDLDEQDVLIETAAVAEALRGLGFDPAPVAFTLDLAAAATTLSKIAPEFVFNLVESVEGRGSLVHLAPALLDHLKVPYTGSHTDAMYLTSNKLWAKKILASGGIPTPEWAESPDGVDVNFPGPYILKSVWEHASVDLDDQSVIADRRFLADGFRKRHNLRGGRCFVERFIDGREFNLSVLAGNNDPEVLPPAEIEFVDFPEGKPKVVSYRAKWVEESFESRNTRRRFEFPAEDADLIDSLKNLAVRCWLLFGLRGYARVDFRVDTDGRPWILEINANPCISPDSGFVAAASRKGLSYSGIIARIVKECGLE